MTAQSTLRSRRSLLTSIAFVVALITVALVFHRPLIAWFTGKSMGGSEGKPVTVQAGPFSIKAALDPDPPRQQGDAMVLEVKDGSGKPVDDATVDVFFDMPAMGAMTEMKGSAKVSHESDGRYRAEFDLPMGSGTWTLQTTIHAQQGDASQDFTMTVGSAGLAARSGTGATMPGMSAPGGADSRLGPVTYAPPAFDALRAAIDAYERTRTALAADRLQSVADSGRAVAEALRAAASSMSNEQASAVDRAKLAAESADSVATAKSLEEARKAFGELNRDFLAVIGADARLTQGWRVFECGMYEGHPSWMQRAPTPDNPYMGTKMPTCGAASPWSAAPMTSPAGGTAPGGTDHYTCSMHPSVKQNTPGTCPICGMGLIPVTKEQQAQGVVTIDEPSRQLIGVRTGPVVVAPMRDAFRALGRIAYDESKLADVNLKVRGWITKLFVNETGQRVTRGQALFTLYSPELYNAEQDFLLASQSAYVGAAPDAGNGRAESLGGAARRRLHLLGLGDAQIDAIARSGKPSEDLAIDAPASGFVIEKNVVDGAAVEAGARLYRIAGLSEVWVEAEVYEADLVHVRVGQPATVTLDYLPGRSFEARVAYVYPYLEPQTRFGRVRIELANKQLELRPGMYANVELASELGTRVQVPVSAVVYAGPRRLAFVDLGQGRFRPTIVRVGVESNGMYEVLAGLEPGDVVATSGVFLIAADARISTSAGYWERSSERTDAGAPAPGPSPSAMPPMPGMPGMPARTP